MIMSTKITSCISSTNSHSNTRWNPSSFLIQTFALPYDEKLHLYKG
jgi:hypothetical protein